MTTYEKWLRQSPKEYWLLGMILFAALPLSPGLAFYGSLSWAIGALCVKVWKLNFGYRLPIHYHMNLIATGLALAVGQPSSLKLIVLVCISTVATLVLTLMITRIFYAYWIPVLLWPATFIAYVFHRGGSALDGQSLPVNQSSCLYAVGLWVIISGLVSPIFLWTSLLGFGLGRTIIWLLNAGLAHSLEVSSALGVAFAVCATVLTMPSLRSLVWALMGLTLSSVGYTFSESLTPTSGLPAWLSLFFWIHFGNALCVYGCRLSSHDRYLSWKLRPEDKLSERMCHWLRFRSGEARVGLPFKGTWKVSQGFTGEWTHRGIWQHALDFIVTDNEGKSFKGSGFELSDYYAYAKEVLAPTSGYIVALFQDYADNPIGAVKNQNNFGNFVVIRDAYGAHIVLAHLKCGSVKPSLYQYVEAGHQVGLCGNSGYSPEPHIHMHVQLNAVIGSPTVRFHVTNFLIEDQFQFHGVPAKNTWISSLDVNASLSRSLAFRVNQGFEFIHTRSSPQGNQQKIEGHSTIVRNQLDPYWGTMFLTDGSAKLYHYSNTLSFYFYHYEGPKHGPLFDLMTAMPRVPLVYGVRCYFQDTAPLLAWSNSWQRWRGFVMSILFEEFVATKTSFYLDCDTLCVTSFKNSNKDETLTSLYLDPVEGFVEYHVGEENYEVKSLRETDVSLDSDVGRLGSGEASQYGV